MHFRGLNNVKSALKACGIESFRCSKNFCKMIRLNTKVPYIHIRVIKLWSYFYVLHFLFFFFFEETKKFIQLCEWMWTEGSRGRIMHQKYLAGDRNDDVCRYDFIKKNKGDNLDCECQIIWEMIFSFNLQKVKVFGNFKPQ